MKGRRNIDRSGRKIKVRGRVILKIGDKGRGRRVNSRRKVRLKQKKVRREIEDRYFWRERNSEAGKINIYINK